jgi:phosphocarrier protein HPr
MSASPEPVLATTSVQVVLRADLHARPAGQIARAAAAFEAAVAVTVDGRRADSRSVLAVMGLGARSGEIVTVWGDGPDAAQAVAAIAQVLTEDAGAG